MIKKSTDSGVKSTSNQQLLLEQLLKNLKDAYSSFKDDIWGTDLADMQLISKDNKGISFLLCVTDLFSNVAWVIPLKDKKGIGIVNAFQNILNNSKRKPNKIWVDQGSELYSKFLKKWLKYLKKDLQTYDSCIKK